MRHLWSTSADYVNRRVSSQVAFYPPIGGANAARSLLSSYGEAELRGGAYPCLRGWGMGEVGAAQYMDRATKKCVESLR